MSTITALPDREARRDAFADRVLKAAAGMLEIFGMYLGDKLGLYAVLAEDGPTTSRELAERTGTHERYVREWLEQQTVCGILSVEDASVEASERRFRLPSGHDEVLADRDSLSFLAPLAQLLAGAVHPLPKLVDAFRTGAGLSFGEYGPDLREGQARMNRPSFLQLLGREWLPSIPDVDAALRQPGARVADIGCGAGWSSIGIARAYPGVRVDGFDHDEPSVTLARANVREAGLSDRVSIDARDATDPSLAGRYDLVTAFECVHDMSDPVTALAAMKRLAGDDGTVLVMDERVGDTFTEQGNEVEWLMYGVSVLHCLPCGMAEHPQAGTGTVMRTDTLRGYARAAGFSDVEVLPIDNFFFRFYRLVP